MRTLADPPSTHEDEHLTPFTFRGDWQSQLVATAIHTGHDLRPEVAELMVLDEDDRFREEDPFTDALGSHVPDQVVVHRSRFEVDLNRPAETAVYATPEQSWGMQVWRDETLPQNVIDRSLAQREEFYSALATRLDEVAARGPFVLFDVHSYNHRRDGAEADPEPQDDNPDVNLGTGSLDRDRWAEVVDTFITTMEAHTVGGERIDVRENIKFEGAELARWVHERYPDTGCALAIEFKKTYMDEWTGEPDHQRIAESAAALGATAQAILEVLERQAGEGKDSSQGDAGSNQETDGHAAEGGDKPSGKARASAAGTPEERPAPGSTELSAADLAIDHQIAQLSTSFEFLSSLTPINAAEAKAAYLAEGTEPTFEYADLPVDPKVVHEQLRGINLDSVEDTVVHQLLASKHRELELQAEMLLARGTDDFLPLSIELYGNISPRLRERAEALLAWVPDTPTSRDRVSAQEFLARAEEELNHYRDLDHSLVMHAELDEDAASVAVHGDTLVVPPSSTIAAARVDALIQHEVGTHLVTRVNGLAQPLKVMGAGLAGYDETQEGLAVLAEIGCGGLTAARLRQLAARVITVHRMVDGASFTECFDHLVGAGFGPGSAFTTTMRVFRSGGFTKDAVYLRGLTDLLDHLDGGGDLSLLWLGKFSLRDLALVSDLWQRGILTEPRVCPRWLDDPQSQTRLNRATQAESLTELFQEGTTR